MSLADFNDILEICSGDWNPDEINIKMIKLEKSKLINIPISKVLKMENWWEIAEEEILNELRNWKAEKEEREGVLI